MTITEIADQISRENSLSAIYSVPSISYWLRNHIGNLNNLLGTDYRLSGDTTSVVPELEEEEKAILKKLFLIYHYDSRIREFLGAASHDIALEVSSDGATVRTVNKNELSKSFLMLRGSEQDDLAKLVHGYKARLVAPLHVAGDDTVAGDPGAFYRRREP